MPLFFIVQSANAKKIIDSYTGHEPIYLGKGFVEIGLF